MDRKEIIDAICKQDAIGLVFIPKCEGYHNYDEFMENPEAYCETYTVCELYDCLPADLIAEYVEGFHDCIMSSINNAIEAIGLDGPISRNWVGESNDYTLNPDECPAWLETDDILLMISCSPNGDVSVEQVSKSNPDGNPVQSCYFTKAFTDR
jgi:hypothetical protein